jgi:NAD-dependent SIR2 family protein deacetylase
VVVSQTVRAELDAAIGQADALLITAGAGMGVDSGLPDFRGKQGFWNAYPHIAKLDLSFSDMANPGWFERDPELAWAFYGHRLDLYRTTMPHQGFSDLLSLCRRKPGGYFVFTSNVDGQFQKAGFESDRMIECHGSIHHFQCCTPCCDSIWSAAAVDISVDIDAFKAKMPLPACIHCGALARPNILMFGDWSWNQQRTDAQYQRFDQWIKNLRADNLKLGVIEIGAGKGVPTVRMFSEQAAGTAGATLMRINPRDFEVPHGHISLPLGGAEGIKAIMEGNNAG